MGVGELSALLSALTIAISGVLNKYLTRRMAPVTLNAVRTTGASIFLVVLFFASGKASEVTSLSGSGLALVVIGGMTTTMIGDTLFLRLLRSVDVSRATTLAQAMVTLLMVATGAVILDEEVTLLTLVGSLLVVAGMYMLSGFSTKRTGRGATPWLGFRNMAFLLSIVLLWVAGLSLMREGLRDVDPITGNVARMVVISSFLLTALSFREGPTLGAEAHALAWARRMAQPNVSLQAAAGDAFRPSSSPSPVVARDHLTGSRPHRRVVHMRGPHSDILGIALGIISGSLSLGLGTTLLFVGLQRAGAAVTMVLLNAQLLLLAPLSMIVLKERISLRSAVGILVSVGGIIVVLI